MTTNTNTDLELTTCAHCGAIIDPEASIVETIEGECYCNASCARLAGYEQCDNCDEWIAADDADAVDINGSRFCNDDCSSNALIVASGCTWTTA